MPKIVPIPYVFFTIIKKITTKSKIDFFNASIITKIVPSENVLHLKNRVGCLVEKLSTDGKKIKTYIV